MKDSKQASVIKSKMVSREGSLDEFRQTKSEIGVRSNRTHQRMEKDKGRSMDKLLQTESGVEFIFTLIMFI